MISRINRIAGRLCLLTVFLIFLAGSVHPQSVSAYKGRWVWKEVARRNKPQTQFTLMINVEGNVVRGVYSVDEFINGEWQGEDGNQTPFIGRMTRGRLEIEFDPDATVPGYQENVRYQPPSDGRESSLATLTLQRGTLLWSVVRGKIESVPSKLKLRRERRPQ